MKRFLAWAAAALLILIALSAPVNGIAERLFSVHMARHILFVLVIPALLLIGMPAGPTFRIPAPLAWATGIGAMIFWHIPAVFHAAMMHQRLHIIELLSLLAAGAVYWWPILSPRPAARLQAVPEGAVYLIASCLACTAMGIVITFAPSPLYARSQEDQQIGGLLMWVPCCLVYLTGTMAMFARWYGEEAGTAHERG